jgi:hypothetical protein
MVLDISSFGAGLGVVMAGWVCGVIVAVVFSVIRKIGGL